MSAANVFDWRNTTGEKRPATETLNAFNPRRYQADGRSPPPLLDGSLSNTASIKTPAFMARPRSKT